MEMGFTVCICNWCIYSSATNVSLLELGVQKSAISVSSELNLGKNGSDAQLLSNRLINI